MDTRLERLEEDVSRSRVESNKLRGIAFSREEDHARILSLDTTTEGKKRPTDKQQHFR